MSNVPMTLNQAVGQLQSQLSARTEEFIKVLPSHITPEKLQRTIVTAVQSDPDLLRADRQSLILACMKAAQDGLLPDKREAALVIFTENRKDGDQWIQTKKVQYVPMVYGLRKKVLQSDEVTDITARVVYRDEVAQGAFIYEEGTEAMLRHKPLLDLTEEQAADSEIIAAYSMATFKDGSKSYEVMRRFEIDKVRETSQTGALKDKKGRPRTPKGPWVDWFPEQAKKTVIRRHSKTLPQSGDIVDVEARDDSIYASSTMDTLASAQEEGPTVHSLPSTAQVEESFDQTTGEVIDEATARDLDNASFAQMDGRADEQHGDQHDGGEAAEDAQAEEVDPKQAIVNGIVDGLIAATTQAHIKKLDAEFVKHRVALDDEQVKAIERELRNAKTRLSKGGE